ncbi:MAG: type IIL restriction-modification enzyme MmeI [Xanthobacteraceae bacterium]
METSISRFFSELLEPWISRFVYDFVGSQEYVKGIVRRCLWIEDAEVADALASKFIAARLEGVRKMRLESDAASTRAFAERPHRFKQIQGRSVKSAIVVPKVTSEERPYLPVGLLSSNSIVSDNAFALYDAPLWNMALIASRVHLVWIATVCGKLETRYRYSNTLGWNTFPVPSLTEKNKADLVRCAEDILLAREAHFPATIAELYDAETMPPDLRAAHDRNDETLERIYIGRRFRNDTERLEKLFELYTKMANDKAPQKPVRKARLDG